MTGHACSYTAAVHPLGAARRRGPVHPDVALWPPSARPRALECAGGAAQRRRCTPYSCCAVLDAGCCSPGACSSPAQGNWVHAKQREPGAAGEAGEGRMFKLMVSGGLAGAGAAQPSGLVAGCRLLNMIIGCLQLRTCLSTFGGVSPVWPSCLARQAVIGWPPGRSEPHVHRTSRPAQVLDDHGAPRQAHAPHRPPGAPTVAAARMCSCSRSPLFQRFWVAMAGCMALVPRSACPFFWLSLSGMSLILCAGHGRDGSRGHLESVLPRKWCGPSG